MKNIRCIIGLLALMAPVALTALEIPLTGGSGDKQVIKIGFVDMELIFQVYPQTKAAKDDYRKKREKMKQDLAQRENELATIKDRIAVLDSTLKGMTSTPNSVATATATAEPDSVSSLKKSLEEKQLDLEESKKRAREDLSAFENRQSQIILGKIYDALRELADEEQITMVVDKSSILYGDASTDLTEKLQQRIRGF